MFAQSERVRRWIARNGYHLVALCQDTAGTRPSLDGFRALLGIATRGQADLVVLPGLVTLSPDKVIQELMLMKLRSYGVAVASTEEPDHADLSEPAVDPGRMMIRDVLHRVAEFSALLEPTLAPLEAAPSIRARDQESSSDEVDVLIELIDTTPQTVTAY
jgi:hypothetical protein